MILWKKNECKKFQIDNTTVMDLSTSLNLEEKQGRKLTYLDYWLPRGTYICLLKRSVLSTSLRMLNTERNLYDSIHLAKINYLFMHSSQRMSLSAAFSRWKDWGWRTSQKFSLRIATRRSTFQKIQRDGSKQGLVM